MKIVKKAKTTKKVPVKKIVKVAKKTSKRISKKAVKKVASKAAKKVTQKTTQKTAKKVSNSKLTPTQISDMAVDSLIISMNEQFKRIETEDEARLIEYITFTTLGDKILEQFGRKTFDQYVKDIIEDFKESK
jgi:hypothetical protein